MHAQIFSNNLFPFYLRLLIDAFSKNKCEKTVQDLSVMTFNCQLSDKKLVMYKRFSHGYEYEGSITKSRLEILKTDLVI